MRVSTNQMFTTSRNYMSRNESDLNQQVGYLSSGKKVLTAKDDAVSYGTLTGYKDELANIQQFRRNIVQAENRNTLIEGSFSSAQNVLNSVKTTFIQANNGSMSDDDRAALAEQLKQNLQEMLDIANARDETGGYVFGGYQIDKQPFLLQPDNSVVYQGDNGTRELKISKSVEVPLNQPGDDAFLKAANPIGDFVGVYNTNVSGMSVNRAIIQDRGAYVDGANYTFDFTDTNGDGNLELTVTDNTATNLITVDPYVPGQTIAFNGMEVNIDGTPLPGGQLELAPQENVSVFEAIKDAIDWVSRTGNVTGTAQHGVDYGHILSNINASLNHISTRQGDAGINLQLIKSQENFHADNELLMEQGRSVIEDLDFATAVTQFEQSKVALQAAQQTYAQLQNLSLFNYI
ncbi:flagellar hook-associated protein FlgL [Thalassotalea sp. LPB0316]|uniref:flagellar hook-associated protein FlgL n=1 Tax=Thalassotalea sp. LPB0316 TaxID=2769490 RepID=UPI001868160C|nr:flagellar hook-associated protein FlgL [Thalassotalea sp. LPB0316]QOL27071.1 flagellar hook-associated protein FlgL [Thalassotalea sp. LPB0316]